MWRFCRRCGLCRTGKQIVSHPTDACTTMFNYVGKRHKNKKQTLTSLPIPRPFSSLRAPNFHAAFLKPPSSGRTLTRYRPFVTVFISNGIATRERRNLKICVFMRKGKKKKKKKRKESRFLLFSIYHTPSSNERVHLCCSFLLDFHQLSNYTKDDGLEPPNFKLNKEIRTRILVWGVQEKKRDFKKMFYLFSLF